MHVLRNSEKFMVNENKSFYAMSIIKCSKSYNQAFDSLGMKKYECIVLLPSFCTCVYYFCASLSHCHIIFVPGEESC